MSLSPDAECARQRIHDLVQVIVAVRHEANRAATLADLARFECADVHLRHAIHLTREETADVARPR